MNKGCNTSFFCRFVKGRPSLFSSGGGGGADGANGSMPLWTDEEPAIPKASRLKSGRGKDGPGSRAGKGLKRHRHLYDSTEVTLTYVWFCSSSRRMTSSSRTSLFLFAARAFACTLALVRSDSRNSSVIDSSDESLSELELELEASCSEPVFIFRLG